MVYWEILENVNMYEEEKKITRNSTIQPEKLLTFWNISL